MRTQHLIVEGVRAQVSGGWIGPDSIHGRMHTTRSVEGSVDIRLDDGGVVDGIPEEGLRAGDRVYHVLYQGHLLSGHHGLDLVNGTTGTRTIEASPATSKRTWAFHAMAVVPAAMLCLMIGLRLGGIVSPLLVVAALAMSPGIIFPLAMGIHHDVRRKKTDARSQRALESCRAQVERAVRSDMSEWKTVLHDASPSASARRAVHIQGTAYLLLEGTVLISRTGAAFIAPGHVSDIPPAAVATCGLEHGAMVHVLACATTTNGKAIAVSDPMLARIWVCPSVFAGRTGKPYRNAIRAAFGRAAWRAVARESDELSRRRTKIRLRA